MEQTDLRTEPLLFARQRWLYLMAVVVIFAVGLALRFYDLGDAPLDFHPTRQLYSAIKARGMYYQHLQDIPDGQRDFAVEQWQLQGLIEPPIMERLSAFTYQLAGQELLWIARLYAILFWMIAGLFLLLTVKELLDENAAIFALLYFLVTPYTVFASRAFQPDPLMVMMMVIALWAVVRWMHTQRMLFAALAGLFAGMAILVKLVVIFPLAVGFAVAVISQPGKNRFWRNKQVWIMGLLAVLPYLLYHVYGIYIVHQLQSQFSLRFFPQLWRDPGFWLRWHAMIDQVIGVEFFLAAIAGIGLLRTKSERLLLLGLFSGYFLYGLALSYHISSHDYYQLPLVPLVAIGVGAVFSWVVRSVQGRKLGMGLIVMALLYLLATRAWDARSTLKRNDYSTQAVFWKSISAEFQPQDQVIGITQDYGYRLIYWGWHSIENWKSSADFSLRELDGQHFDMQAEFFNAIEGKDYFLITDMVELNRQPLIKQLLNENFAVRTQSSDLIIYDLHQRLKN